MSIIGFILKCTLPNDPEYKKSTYTLILYFLAVTKKNSFLKMV